MILQMTKATTATRSTSNTDRQCDVFWHS